VLSRPEFAGATILIASPDFCARPVRGYPARQDAASALAGRGFLVVISAGFDDIFRNNITKYGMLPLYLPIGKVIELQDMAESDQVRLFTVDPGNREVTAGDRFSAVCDIANRARRPLPGGLAGISPAAGPSSGSAGPDGQRPASLPAHEPAYLADWIRTAQHRISCLDVPSDVRIHLQRRLVAVCDAMKSTAADPARCERRLAALAAELDRLAAVLRGEHVRVIPGKALPGRAKAQSEKSLNSRPTRQ
jgi:3-isopropylmalate/(R)-2-methylmalate dehydratase small subunit